MNKLIFTTITCGVFALTACGSDSRDSTNDGPKFINPTGNGPGNGSFAITTHTAYGVETTSCNNHAPVLSARIENDHEFVLSAAGGTTPVGLWGSSDSDDFHYRNVRVFICMSDPQAYPGTAGGCQTATVLGTEITGPQNSIMHEVRVSLNGPGYGYFQAVQGCGDGSLETSAALHVEVDYENNAM